MTEIKEVPLKEILTKVEGQPIKIVNPFTSSKSISDIKDVTDSGLYSGTDIFDPKMYTTDGVTTPTNDDSTLQAYYEKLIKASVGNTNIDAVIIPSVKSTQRPRGVVGLTLFDTTINKLIVFNGSSWVDLAGRIV